jgi:hypothetical protein
MVLMDAGWFQHAFYNRLYWWHWELKFHSNLKNKAVFCLSLFLFLSRVCVLKFALCILCSKQISKSKPSPEMCLLSIHRISMLMHHTYSASCIPVNLVRVYL